MASEAPRCDTSPEGDEAVREIVKFRYWLVRLLDVEVARATDPAERAYLEKLSNRVFKEADADGGETYGNAMALLVGIAPKSSGPTRKKPSGVRQRVTGVTSPIPSLVPPALPDAARRGRK